MKLQDLAAKPKLIKITIDDEETIATYGEPLEFYVYDRQPVENFMRLARLGEGDFGDLVRATSDLILDEAGNKIITDENVLPQKVYTRVIERVIKQLGE